MELKRRANNPLPTIKKLREELEANGWRLSLYCAANALNIQRVKKLLGSTQEGRALLSEIAKRRPPSGARGYRSGLPRIEVSGWDPDLLAAVEAASGADRSAWIRDACAKRLLRGE